MKKTTKKTAAKKRMSRGRLRMKYSDQVERIATALRGEMPDSASFAEAAEIALAALGIKAKGAK